jgi:flagellar L-ring protein precursor FlgH
MKNGLVIILMLPLISGCSSFGKKLKAFLGGKTVEPAAEVQKSEPTHLRYSDTNNHLTGPKRQYKRVTKKTLEDEALLNSNTGSLWVMEGQGAYLFSQNVVRMIGDPLAVRIEGDPRDQLASKADVIKKLVDQLEARAKAQAQARTRQPAAAGPADQGGAVPPAEGAPQDGQAQAAQKPAAPPEAAKDNFNVNRVTTRVIERTVDGNYRIKGSQPFMIGSREYKVIVTGVVRAEDFNEDGISAKDLLDPSFDIVGVRSKEM